MVGFIVGLFIGAFIGMLIAALLVSGKDTIHEFMYYKCDCEGEDFGESEPQEKP